MPMPPGSQWLLLLVHAAAEAGDLQQAVTWLQPEAGAWSQDDMFEAGAWEARTAAPWERAHMHLRVPTACDPKIPECLRKRHAN